MLDRSVALDRLLLAVVALLTVWGIGSFGIWDPWELDAANAARTLIETGRESSVRTPLSTASIAAAFEMFGIRDWSGRLPGVLAAWLSCVLAFLLLRGPGGGRAGVVTVAVMASTPMFLLNARLLMGNAIEVFAQTWV
ncbi:MAG: glycosyltransferase family 39 protein, partial [Polyangiales bacterium]